MEFLRQECWRGLPFPPRGDLPNPGMELGSLLSPALAAGFFVSVTTWEARSGCSQIIDWECASYIDHSEVKT